MMGRKRIHREDLPARVYFNHGAYYFVTKKGEWIKLSRQYPAAMKRYAEIIEAPGGKGVMGDLIRRFLNEISPQYASQTHKNNLQNSKRLTSVFGPMSPDDITPQDIYKFMDILGAPVSANRHVSLLSDVFKYAIRWGMARDNPCRLVSRNPEKPRDREVTDEEFSAVRPFMAPSIQCAMDIGETTALRLGNVLNLNERDNIREEGIYAEIIKRKKTETKKRLLFLWTDDLRSIYENCRKLRGNVLSIYLICNKMGQRYTMHGFESLWRAGMKRALKAKSIKEPFTYRDLRARAAGKSAHATELLAHDDPRTTNRIYRRITRKVTPNIRQ